MQYIILLGEIPQTIIEQFGGREALALIGGKVVSAGRWSITIKFRGCAKADYFRVIYDTGADLYNLEFRKGEPEGEPVRLRLVEKYKGVFCDQLQSTFAGVTGINMDSVRVEFDNMYVIEAKEGA